MRSLFIQFYKKKKKTIFEGHENGGNLQRGYTTKETANLSGPNQLNYYITWKIVIKNKNKKY